MGDYVGNLGKVSSSCSCTVQWPAVTAVTAGLGYQDSGHCSVTAGASRGTRLADTSFIQTLYLMLMIMCGVLLQP